MLFKSLFIASLLVFASAMPASVLGPDGKPIPDTTTTPTTGDGSAGGSGNQSKVKAQDVTPPPSTPQMGELAQALMRIMLSNRIGGVPPNCQSKTQYDALICNFPSMLTEVQVQEGIKQLQDPIHGIGGFENIKYVDGTKTKKGYPIVKWGGCKNIDGSLPHWTSALGLTRIFGGKSCTVVHLSKPTEDQKKDLEVAKQAVQNLVAGGAGGAGGTTTPTTGTTTPTTGTTTPTTGGTTTPTTGTTTPTTDTSGTTAPTTGTDTTSKGPPTAPTQPGTGTPPGTVKGGHTKLAPGKWSTVKTR